MIQATTFLSILIISSLETIGLIIMVNQRSSTEMREAKEHFDLIFHNSLDAVLITRLNDGIIVNANEGFSTLSGYLLDETVGKSTLTINIFKNPVDRQKIVAELGNKGFCDNYEALFRHKDGGLLNGVVCAKIFPLQDIPLVISITRDITEHKQAEHKLR
jgi:PAS domain S-box-containing protein